MLSSLNYLLVTVTCFVSACTAIRVEWNTNTGPIIPPTPRPTVRPVPPFKEPAAVWEDLTNDIPNPNPYIYVPPPPSRPKQRLNTNVDYNINDNNAKSYGTIVRSHNPNTYNNNSPQVASLSPQYVPNVGATYVAVVPTIITAKSSVALNKSAQIPSANALSPDDKTSYKLHGKYNVKTKKYKVYEKVKYVPLNYYPSLESSSANTTAVQSPPPLQGEQKLGHHKDQWITTVAPMKTYSSSKSYTKHVYAKDKTTLKPKEKLNDSVSQAKNS